MRRIRVLRYVVVGPDGLPIAPTTFDSRARAERALEEWCSRYREQGYYAAADGRRIPLDTLREACRIDTQPATLRTS